MTEDPDWQLAQSQFLFHMWSSLNQLAHLATWQKCPDDMKAVIERNVATYVRLQRQDQERANTSVRATLVKRGLASTTWIAIIS